MHMLGSSLVAVAALAMTPSLGQAAAVVPHGDTILMAQACHPSYEGECVPIASDADCASGSGNGPVYVRGPVRVVGPDEYDLDRDGDGVGCE